MAKILHTADIHLGALFAVLGERANEYREQLKKTFVKIIDLALKEKADLVLVAGDLFDSNFPAGSTVSLIKEQFERLADKDIQVAILPGTHDCLDENSIYWRENLGANVFVFKKAAPQVYPDLNLTLWAKPNTSKKSTESPLIPGLPRQKFTSGEFLSRNDKTIIPATRYNIAVAHGSVVELAAKVDDQQYPMHLADILKSPFDYVALGHWHSLRKPEEFQNKACYPGAPEPLAFTEKGAGYAVMITAGGEGGASLQIKPVKVGNTEFDELEIDLGLLESAEQLKKEILKGAAPNLVRQVKLQGLASTKFNLDLPSLEKQLSEKFFRLIINDHSHLAIEEFELGQYPQELVIGQFVRLMQECLKTAKDEHEKQIIKRALQLGLAALTNEGFEF